MSPCSLVDARRHITKGTVIVGHLGYVDPTPWVRGKNTCSQASMAGVDQMVVFWVLTPCRRSVLNVGGTYFLSFGVSEFWPGGCWSDWEPIRTRSQSKKKGPSQGHQLWELWQQNEVTCVRDQYAEISGSKQTLRIHPLHFHSSLDEET